ncbi:MAG: hypothetical protein SW833_25300 [Cyanobacteriota bacterium]|nr:hypothetical protein [Cyanobacteriota bacterium]
MRTVAIAIVPMGSGDIEISAFFSTPRAFIREEGDSCAIACTRVGTTEAIYF